jgi:hypothetical protein
VTAAWCAADDQLLNAAWLHHSSFTLCCSVLGVGTSQQSPHHTATSSSGGTTTSCDCIRSNLLKADPARPAMLLLSCTHFLLPCLLPAALCAASQHSTAWSLLRRITANQGRLPLRVLHRLLKLAGQVGVLLQLLVQDCVHLDISLVGSNKGVCRSSCIPPEHCSCGPTGGCDQQGLLLSAKLPCCHTDTPASLICLPTVSTATEKNLCCVS